MEKSDNNIIGGVELVDGMNSEELAKMALILMIHSFENKRKISPGYFFHAGLKGKELKENVLKAIVRAWESNVDNIIFNKQQLHKNITFKELVRIWPCLSNLEPI